jgi:hypothetical protein
MGNIFVQYETGRFLACGYHPPPGLIGLKIGQAGKVWTALILDAPADIDPRQAADLFFQTRIEPPCFWLPFAALGPGREITGRALALAEAATLAGLTRDGMKKALARGDLPGFRGHAAKPVRGQVGYLVNSLDLERFILTPRNIGRPPKPKPPEPAVPRPRGRPKGAKDTRPRRLWHQHPSPEDIPAKKAGNGKAP